MKTFLITIIALLSLVFSTQAFARHNEPSFNFSITLGNGGYNPSWNCRNINRNYENARRYRDYRAMNYWSKQWYINRCDSPRYNDWEDGRWDGRYDRHDRWNDRRHDRGRWNRHRNN